MRADEAGLARRLDLPWQASSVRNQPGASSQWVRIPLGPRPDIAIGLSATGRWAVSLEGGLVFLDNASDFTPLLPLLELWPAVFAAELAAAFGELRLSPSWASAFPLERLIVFGLESEGDYWPRLALNWAETFGASDVLTAALGRTLSNGPTQEVRHWAKRLFFERSARPLQPGEGVTES